LNDGLKVIDFSGDFRLSTPEVYRSWYNKEHNYPEGFKQAIYGIPETNSEKIENTDFIANPGCYPTGAILGILPLVANSLVEKNIIVDSKSGVTGAGIKPKDVTNFANVNDNFTAYGVSTHRHTIEIRECINGVAQSDMNIQFTPHLLPVDRGIISTIYSRPIKQIENLMSYYQEYYVNAPFIRICDSPPTLKDVRGTNYCNIFTKFDENTGNIITITAIDNLVKGAAGQAVHNMNIRLGIKETKGLELIPLRP
ncbi:MAG: N-acetyl-gamma-glutamyl-phosphate reductase, partial [Flavobacteriales bacterium]